MAIEGDARAMPRLEHFVRSLGGRVVHVAAGMKATYHAGLCFASNYAVVCAAIGEGLVAQAVSDPDVARSVVGPLFSSTARNLAEFGAERSLTGPIARGNMSTVAAHVRGLMGVPSVRSLYAHLGIHAVGVAQGLGLSDASAQALKRELHQAMGERLT